MSRKEETIRQRVIWIRLADGGARLGNLRCLLWADPGRCSRWERGGPETKPRSCGSQTADESLLNRRLQALSFARPIVIINW